MNPLQSFEHNIVVKKLNYGQMLGANRKNSLKKRGFRHVTLPMVSKCWPKVNKCWLFRKFETFLFNLHSALSPDLKSCLDQKLCMIWSFFIFQSSKNGAFCWFGLGSKGLRSKMASETYTFGKNQKWNCYRFRNTYTKQPRAKFCNAQDFCCGLKNKCVFCETARAL